jgi:hypothetical protein
MNSACGPFLQREIWDVIAEMPLYADDMVVFLSTVEKDLVIPAGI